MLHRRWPCPIEKSGRSRPGERTAGRLWPEQCQSTRGDGWLRPAMAEGGLAQTEDCREGADLMRGDREIAGVLRDELGKPFLIEMLIGLLKGASKYLGQI